MKRCSKLKARFLQSEEGPTAVEYALLLGVISLTVIGAMSMFGAHMDALYVILSDTLNVF